MSKSKYLLLLLVGCTLAISTCKEEIDYPAAPIYTAGEQELGWSTATKNGQAFEASVFARQGFTRPDEFFGLNLRTFTEWGADRESLSVSELTYETGRRTIIREDMDQFNGIPIGFYATRSDDGDVLEDVYRIDERQSNWIEITAIDTVDNQIIVRGCYDLHFVIDREKTNPLNPDHVRFLDGCFEAQVEP